ncbi:MAG: DUF4886 domain-containing protein [Pseudomonadota bacterium]
MKVQTSDNCGVSPIFFKKTEIVIICCIMFLSLTGCDFISGFCSSKRVLFIGNSYTATAGIPNVFAELAKSGGHKVEVGIGADKGGSFAAYAQSAAVQTTMKSSRWDFVVLQEQSQIPSNVHLRSSKMYPPARELVRQIRSIGATPIFFQTSGNRNGWPENGLPKYENMQLEIIQGYSEIAEELGVPVAPVGHAWFVAMKSIPQFNPWVDDRHPNEQGAYLAACIFYATLFRESPEGAKYTANLSNDLAMELQKIAADAVLQNLQKWNL